jgi:uncharacterized protein (TIGR00730 family)
VQKTIVRRPRFEDPPDSSPGVAFSRSPEPVSAERSSDSIGNRKDSNPDEQREALLLRIISIASALARSCMSLDDLQMMSHTLQDMCMAAETFSSYSDRPKCTFFGGVRVGAEDENFQLARALAAELVRRGFMVITGGGGGIMAAAQQGAGAANSFGLRVDLPFENHPNETIQGDPKLIDYKYFFARKIGLAKETNAFIVFPGGYGTLDETYEVLTLMQTGKSPIVPLVLMDHPGGNYWQKWKRFVVSDLLENGFISESDLQLFTTAHAVDTAVEHIAGFYRAVASCRRRGSRIHVTLRQPLSERLLATLNRDLGQLLDEGGIRQQCGSGLESESDPLPQLIFTPKHQPSDSWRQLLDAINRTA